MRALALLLLGLAIPLGGGRAALQQGGSIEYGETVDGQVSSERGEAWLFSGDAGDEVRIAMSSRAMDTYVELFGPDDDLLAENDDARDGTDSLVEAVVLPRSGRYTIVARGFAGETGPYQLSLERTDSSIEIHSGGGDLAYGETVSGRVTVQRGDSWTFAGDAGDEVRVQMSSPMIDSYLELLGPDGDILASDDDSGGDFNALVEGFVLPEPGRYTIVARSYGGETGSYHLSLERTDTDVQIRSGGRIDFGETVTDRINTEAGDAWTFKAGSGDVVTIRMESDSLDTYLELLDPDGFLLADDDDGGGNTNSLIDNYWLADGGTYTVMARGYGGEIGSYRLTLERVHRGGGLGATLTVGLAAAVGLLCLAVVAVLGLVTVAVLVGRSSPRQT